MNRMVALAAALVLPSLAAAHDYKLGDLGIIHPMTFETPVTAKTGAGYVIIANDGKTDDALLEVRADFPKVMLHKSEEKDGIASMMHVDKIDIPAGEVIELAPGGYHVMFMGLGGDPFEQGETVKATLVFEQAGEVEIEFQVVPRDSEQDHSDHDMTN